jgi:uroporphyrin-III C-methyltransferase
MNPDNTPKASEGSPRPPVDLLARPPAKASKDSRPSRTALWVLAMSFVMGLIALLGALYLEKSFERKIERLDLRVDEIRREIQDGLRPGLRSLTERQDSLAAAGAQLTERVSRMEEQLAQNVAAGGQLSAMVQGGRRSWILYEVEYLLLNANDRLLLEADVAGALRALEAASQRLGVAADPQLLQVRTRIAQEMTALRAIPQPDIEAIALTLSALAANVSRMPLRSPVPANFSAAESPAAAAPAQGRVERFLQMLARALRGLAIIRRENRPLEPLLPPDQAFFLYQNLQLKLESARLSALQRDTTGFRASVAGARRWLQEYFASDDPQVAAAVKELTALEREQLDWTLPDVTGSLNLLRREMEARGVRPTQAAPVPPPAPPESPAPATNAP